MAGTLTRLVTGESQIGYGVNIWEVVPPGSISGVSTTEAAMVADLPWGPVNSIQKISQTGEFFDLFAPEPFGAQNSYTALRALLNKRFPGGLKVCRIAATGAATATFTFDDAAVADSVDADARYPGVLGNSLSVAWTVNADDANARDATVSIGTAYSRTYKAVCTTTGGLALTDPGDPYVVFSLAAGATDVPAAIAATALAGGLDGTAVAADYTGSAVSIVGIRKFYADAQEPAVLFCGEVPSALCDAVNTGLVAYCTDNDKGMVVLCTPDGQDKATAEAYPSSYRDDRVVYVTPRVKTTNFFDPTLAEVEVDGNAFAAAAIVSVDPELSPGGAPGAPALVGITGLENEDLSTVDYDDLNDAGAAPFFLSNTLGPIIRRGISTTLTDSLKKIFRRRMTDFITRSIAQRMEAFVEQPLDLILGSETLGPVTGPQIGEINQFLGGLVGASRIQSYSVDPFSGNTQAILDSGRWVILISAKLYSAQEEIVLKANIGETVEISEA